MRTLATVALGCGLALSLVSSAGAALVAHYDFDGNATDSSGGGHDGTAFGGVSYVAGKVGSGAASFDGSTGYITAPYASELAFAGSSYTVAFWANIAEVKNSGPISIFDNQADYNGGNTVAFLGLSGTTRSIHNDGGPNPYDFTTPTVAVTGTWAHYALVYDTSVNIRTLYVDGVSVGTAATNGDLIDRASGALRIGALFNPDLGNFFFYHGSIDDVRLYNDALSAGAVGDLVNPVPEPSMMALASVAGLGLLRRTRRSA